MKRKHENLITNGIQKATGRRPLNYSNQDSPSVLTRPSNIREIVSLWGRLKAAWLVFTTNAYAVRWYNDENAHTWRPDWYEENKNVLRHSDYIKSSIKKSGINTMKTPTKQGLVSTSRTGQV